jgi:Ca2+-binding RTX toxin-like protein
MDGWRGNDTYFVNSYGDVVKEQAGSDYGIDTVWSTLNTTYLAANVENLHFNGVGNFTGVGNEHANTITGSAGTDRLEGAGGDDVLVGGGGPDALIGGDGVDTASYAAAAEGVDARLLGLGYAGDALGDTYAGVENLIGSAFADVLFGNEGANVLSGGAGSDYLNGYTGDDVLNGGDGSDALDGASGNDVLRGGRQADTLIGGFGEDVFDFDGVAESAPGARDVIRAGEAPAFEGFGSAGGDRIDLSGIDANASKGGNQAFAFGGTGIGRLSVVNSGTDSLVRCNTDKDAAFEFELRIEDGAVLANAYKAVDFIL